MGNGMTRPHIIVKDLVPWSARHDLPQAYYNVHTQEVTLKRAGDPFFDEGQGPLSDVTRDRVTLAPSKEARLYPPNTPQEYPPLRLSGSAAPITFESYVTDPRMVPDHSTRNDILYNLNRGYCSRSYRFIGFVRSHDVVYLGLVYIMGGPSDQSRGRNEYQPLLFRLDPDPGTPTGIALRPVTLPTFPSNTFYVYVNADDVDCPPLLDTVSDNGDLYLLYGHRIWQFQQARQLAASTDSPTAWVDHGDLRSLLPALPRPPKPPPGYASFDYRDTQVFLRGRWLVLRSQYPDNERWRPGSARSAKPRHLYDDTTQVRIFDVTSGRLARTILWSSPVDQEGQTG